MVFLTRVAAARTTSVAEAAMPTSIDRYPILIYGPGAGGKPFRATFQAEFLASHGYVVMSIGHTDVANIERFPDGYIYRKDRTDAILPILRRKH